MKEQQPDVVVGQAINHEGWFAAAPALDAIAPVFADTLDEALEDLAVEIDRWLDAVTTSGADTSLSRSWAARSDAKGSILTHLRDRAGRSGSV